MGGLYHTLSVSYSYGNISGTLNGGTNTLHVQLGSQIKLVASSLPFFYEFVGWSGNVTSRSGQVDLSVNSPETIIARFSLNYFHTGLLGFALLLLGLAAYVALRPRKLTKDTPLPPVNPDGSEQEDSTNSQRSDQVPRNINWARAPPRTEF